MLNTFRFLKIKENYLLHPSGNMFLRLLNIVSKDDLFVGVYWSLHGMGEAAKRKYGVCNTSIYNGKTLLRDFPWLL